MSITINGKILSPDICTEPGALDGIKRICKVVSGDFEAVTGEKPCVCEVSAPVAGSIFACTLGHSEYLDGGDFEDKFALSALRGKREVYELAFIDDTLFVIGSDKRGTIYGLFRLSELIGVSPLVFWGDARPEFNPSPEIMLDEPFISKEPSVEYRGFFINDEWPAFGNWTLSRYGGVNAKAYEDIFIFLLRLKGNYMWPAMWNSSFSDDGPGLENAILADELGVVMGASHHEPMCRAGVEWQRIYEQYGESNAWSFLSNRDAITNFWKDGILRNKDFENIITIGMRGENDSVLLPENATLADNINVVKEAILAQHELMRENLNPDLSKVNRMLAIYKEVEDFYYGDETCEGLKDWDELKDVTFLLCDDNFGCTRGLPEPENANHPGGFGMYFHFDYHGGPISYEWQNTNRLSKTREQMVAAYERGVRKLWIVNVGDLKGVEYPLCFFMDLAYDYDRWSGVGSAGRYLSHFIDSTWGKRLSTEVRKDMFELIEGCSRLAAARKPETMHPGIFSPFAFRESERIHARCRKLDSMCDRMLEVLREDCIPAYKSIFYYQFKAILNVILMNLEAGFNDFYASRGSLYANVYIPMVKMRVANDHRLIDDFHAFMDGKWNHMMDSAHTGFNDWDDKNWSYPVLKEFIPVHGPKICVGFRGSDKFHLGAHWQDAGPLENSDLCGTRVKEVIIDVDCRGDVPFTFKPVCDSSRLNLSYNPVTVSPTHPRESITVTLKDNDFAGYFEANITIEVSFANGEETTSSLLVKADTSVYDLTDLPAQTALEECGYIVIPAESFTSFTGVNEAKFVKDEYLGRMGSAIRIMPVTDELRKASEFPSVTYSLFALSDGDYTVELFFVPRNPAVTGLRVNGFLSANGDTPAEVVITDESFYPFFTCSEWSDAVLNNCIVKETNVKLNKGYNTLTFSSPCPETILEKLVVYPAGAPLPKTFLGAPDKF